MHVLIDRLSDAERAEAIEDTLRHALDYVRAVVGDGGALTGAAATAAAELRGTFSPRSAQEVSETADFLYWLISGNMTFLGYQRYEIARRRPTPTPVPGSGLGILRDSVAGQPRRRRRADRARHRRSAGAPAADPGVRRLGPDPGRAAVRGAGPDPRPGRRGHHASTGSSAC